MGGQAEHQCRHAKGNGHDRVGAKRDYRAKKGICPFYGMLKLLYIQQEFIQLFPGHIFLRKQVCIANLFA
jgi:hypothetical protein